MLSGSITPKRKSIITPWVTAHHRFSDQSTAFTQPLSFVSRAGCCFTDDRLPTDTSVWEGPQVSVSISTEHKRHRASPQLLEPQTAAIRQQSDGTTGPWPGNEHVNRCEEAQRDSRNIGEFAADNKVFFTLKGAKGFLKHF